MDPIADLEVLLASRYPLLFVETSEEQRFLDILEEACRRVGCDVWTWSTTSGLRRRSTVEDPFAPPASESRIYGTEDPAQAIAFIADTTDRAAFVLADAHHLLGDPRLVRLIKETAQAMTPGQTLVLTMPRLEVPAELASIAHRWTLGRPGRTELTELVHAIARDHGAHVDLAVVPRLVDAVSGLRVPEAARLLRRAARDGALDGQDVPVLRTGKVDVLVADTALESVATEPAGMDALGGLDALRRWLDLRRAAFDGSAPELPSPRGILLTGVPGTGKSFTARAIAGGWDLPLVLLDPGRLYGRFVGESEERLDRTLAAVDAMAPVCLWIDEIEKGFARSAADGGVSERLLGTFLRWLQDRPPGIFVVATANDVSRLPAELLRKGRFDEVFFVDLPDASARRRIWEVHLARRGLEDVDIDRLVAATDGFSGAEIEAAVVGARYRAAANGAAPTTDDVLAEVAGTVPLSRARPELVEGLRRWAAGRAVVA